MNAASLALALFIGMLLPLQALINGALAKHSFGPVFASLASFSVGTLVLLAWWLASRPALEATALAKVPWWAWTGGVIGALYVAGATLLIPRMGAASLICVVVLGRWSVRCCWTTSASCIHANPSTACASWAPCW